LVDENTEEFGRQVSFLVESLFPDYFEFGCLERVLEVVLEGDLPEVDGGEVLDLGLDLLEQSGNGALPLSGGLECQDEVDGASGPQHRLG
jgi:hypothetical protein